jgi:hypothetical protein
MNNRVKETGTAQTGTKGLIPIALLWLLSRLSYDRRALGRQSVVAIIVLLISYIFAPVPPPSTSNPNWAVNINYVYGLDDEHPQTLMSPWLWLLLLMAVNVIAIYLPTHFVLRRFFKALSSRQVHSGNGDVSSLQSQWLR